MKRLTHEEFIRRAILSNPGKEPGVGEYSYPNRYQGGTIEVLCHEHGLFPTSSKSHLNGKGCPKCRSLRAAASNLGIPFWAYKEAVANGQRYCKAHGFQDISEYLIHTRGAKSSDWNPVYECRKCLSTRNTRRYADKKEVIQDLRRVSRRALRLEVLRHYSSDLCCAICGEDHYEFLALDHIHGGEKAHRGLGVSETYWRSFKKNGWPEGFRVLCHNCNLEYRDAYSRKLPRKDESLVSHTKSAIRSRKLYNDHPDWFKRYRQVAWLRLKKEVIGFYGGACACCGIENLAVLSIDHLNGGGSSHAKELRKLGERFDYRWLKMQGFPQGYQVLCMNCNQAKGIYGQCPHEIERQGHPCCTVVTA